MENNHIIPENDTNDNKPVETDSEKIVRRHLENKDDQITDEDIRSVRVTGEEEEEPVTTGAEAKARFVKDDSEEKTSEEDTIPPTPWEVVK